MRDKITDILKSRTIKVGEIADETVLNRPYKDMIVWNELNGKQSLFVDFVNNDYRVSVFPNETYPFQFNDVVTFIREDSQHNTNIMNRFPNGDILDMFGGMPRFLFYNGESSGLLVEKYAQNHIAQNSKIESPYWQLNGASSEESDQQPPHIPVTKPNDVDPIPYSVSIDVGGEIYTDLPSIPSNYDRASFSVFVKSWLSDSPFIFGIHDTEDEFTNLQLITPSNDWQRIHVNFNPSEVSGLASGRIRYILARQNGELPSSLLLIYPQIEICGESHEP